MSSDNISAKKHRILDAALRVFAEKGFHNTTVSEVAKEACVGKGTVYLYFEGKEALLVAIFDELADHMIHIIDQLSLEGTQLRGAVGRLVSNQADIGRTKEQVFQLLSQQPFLTTLSLQQEKQSLIERLVAKLAARIGLATEEGLLRHCDPTLAACVLLSMPGAISLYAIANREANLPESLPEVTEELSEMLWIGLQKENQ
ncbi:TetR/AcrR family transcriptional regulator [Candidatus Bipolaricaulota bacterium]|nr:TetR/AcrR family transcriptional regulator [Candidatus Bipolaricaulota bacterium]